MSKENPNPFPVEGADGPFDIPEGRYFRNAKRHPELLQRKQFKLSARARMVYACLELATIAFAREKAMKGKDGESPLTNADIARRTGLSRQNVRHALIELEDAGLVERRQIDLALPLQNGNIVICVWAEPRAPKHDGEKKGSRARLPFPDWVPESWGILKPFINRHKLTLQTDLPLDEGAARDYLDRLAELARSYMELEKEIARELETVCALPISAPYKEKEKETIERTNERPGSAGTPAPEPVRPSPPSPAPEPDKPDKPATPSIRESLREFLSPNASRFGLRTQPDDVALTAIAAEVPNEAVLISFCAEMYRRKPQPKTGGWMYFVPVAQSLRKGWEAEEDLVRQSRERAAEVQRSIDAAAAEHARNHGPLYVDPFPEIPDIEPEKPEAPAPAFADTERETAAREVAAARKAAERTEIEERRKRNTGKPPGREVAEAIAILKARGSG